MNTGRNSAFSISNPAYILLAVLIFGVGVLSRFYGAWACQYIRNPDTGIVALMVKHMAEGKEWPLFFYGQAYMGTLEPMISLLLTPIFGVTGLAVCAGTALAAVCSLPVIFLWGRDAAGRPGALAALALCAAGPYYYFMFQFAPRGGYTVTLLLGLLVMWLSTRIAVRLFNSEDSARGGFALIGFLAGLGWWTNPLITPALAASALILAIGLRGRFWRSGVLFGLLGFAVGSLPFWTWNLLHEWASFNMFSSVGNTGTIEGLRFLGRRYERLVGLKEWAPGPRMLALLILPVLTTLGAGIGIMGFHKRKFSLSTASALTLSVFILVSIVVFVRSSFAHMNTARYLLPLVPASAILCGFFVQRLRQLAGPAVAAVPVLLVVATHWPAIPELQARHADTPRRIKSDAKLGRFFQKRGVEVVFSHFVDHALNFNLNESVVVTDMRSDRYSPYSRRAEMAENIAVLRNYGHIAQFSATAGGTRKTKEVGGYWMRYAFSPPVGGLADITDAALRHVLDRDGRNCLPELTDCNIDTDWVGRHDGSREEWLELQFEAPVTIRALRLRGMSAQCYPAKARIDVKRSSKEPWETLQDAHVVTDFFWSGPRPYWGGRRARQEYRFDDISAVAVRVVSLAPRVEDGGWRVSEIRCFGPGPEIPAETDGLPELLEVLRERKIRSLYADRWVSNRVYEEFDRLIRVELAPEFFPETPLRGGSVDWSGGPAFLVKPHDLATTIRTLSEHNITIRERNVGPWSLLETDFTGEGTVPAALDETDLYWTGYNLLGCNRADPVEEVNVEFPHGISLSGFSVLPSRVECGGEINVVWFWRLSGLHDAKKPFIFVHFRSDDGMFQDDHTFFGPACTWRASNGGHSYLLWDRRSVRVPLDAVPGTWDIHVGLYDPLYGKRFRPRTDLPTVRRAVVLKNAFTVVRKKEGSD